MKAGRNEPKALLYPYAGPQLEPWFCQVENEGYVVIPSSLEPTVTTHASTYSQTLRFEQCGQTQLNESHEASCKIDI